MRQALCHLHHTLCFYFVFETGSSYFCPHWRQTFDPPVSLKLPGLQACTTMPGHILAFKPLILSYVLCYSPSKQIQLLSQKTIS
jgi:hypothetical protein